MNHYHLISTCTFSEAPRLEEGDPLHGCLYKLKKPQRELFEEIYIFSGDSKDETLENKKFIIADFFYMKEEKLTRCYVLCPIITSTSEWIQYFDHIYKMPLRMEARTMIPGPTSCSPKGYAYHDGKKLYQFNIDDENYAAMLCFPHQQNSLIRTYLAFCKVNEEHLHRIDHEWAHKDDPVYLQTEDTILENRRKKFLYHSEVKPDIPSHGVDH